MGGLHLIKAGVGGNSAKKLVQSLVKIENHSDLGEPLEGSLPLAFQKLEGGKRNSSTFGKLRLAPTAGPAVVPDPLPDLTDQARRIANLKR